MPSDIIQNLYSNLDEAADMPLKVVSEATGLSPLVIRSWERRYGFPRPGRSPGGHRRYSTSEASAVGRAAMWVRAGLRPREAIERALAGERAELPPSRSHDQLAVELAAGDPWRALGRLRALALVFGPEMALEEMIFPALRRVGELWATGAVTVDQEHAAAGIVASWLGMTRVETSRPFVEVPRVVIADVPGELHWLPTLALEILLSRRRVPAISLGADLPTSALIAAVSRWHPTAVVLAALMPAPERELSAAAAALAAARPAPRLLTGGPGFQGLTLPPGVELLPNRLTDAADAIAGEIQPAL